MKKILLLTFVLLLGFTVLPQSTQAANQTSQQAAQWYDLAVQARFDDTAGMVYFDVWFMGGLECEIEIIVNGVSYILSVNGVSDGILQLPGYSYSTTWTWNLLSVTH